MKPEVSGYCEGEFCICGKPAVAKVEETIFDDDWSVRDDGPNGNLPRGTRGRHPLTSYLCEDHFALVMHGKPLPESDAKPGRYDYVPAPQAFVLDHVCQFISQALNETCYLVGSATRTSKYRDVDVRIIMADEKYATLFGSSAGVVSPFWSLFCASVSEYLAKRTGLPIDFQVQRYSDTLHEDGIRMPIGHYTPADGPTWSLGRTS